MVTFICSEFIKCPPYEVSLQDKTVEGGTTIFDDNDGIDINGSHTHTLWPGISLCRRRRRRLFRSMEYIINSLNTDYRILHACSTTFIRFGAPVGSRL